MNRCSRISSIVCGSRRKSSIASWRRPITAVNAVDHLDERLAPLDDALVVEGHVVVGLLVAHLRQARLEILEIAPHVAVVRTESRQVDVGQEEHAVDPESAVATGVSGQVHRFDGYTAAEIEHVTVRESLRVGTAARSGTPRGSPARTRSGPCRRRPYTAIRPSIDLRAGQVVDVDVEPRVGKRSVARHVVLVAVAVDHRVDRYRNTATGDHGHRWIDRPPTRPRRAPAACCPTGTRRWRRRPARSRNRSAVARRRPSRSSSRP